MPFFCFLCSVPLPPDTSVWIVRSARPCPALTFRHYSNDTSSSLCLFPLFFFFFSPGYLVCFIISLPILQCRMAVASNRIIRLSSCTNTRPRHATSTDLNQPTAPTVPSTGRHCRPKDAVLPMCNSHRGLGRLFNTCPIGHAGRRS